MKLLVEKLILILAIFSSASGAFAATSARGLVLWRQPPADAVSALEFVTVTRSNVAFSSVLLPTGERVEIPRGGVVAFIDYPSETPTVSEAEAAIRNLEAAIPKYPFCTARLRAALTKWNNALAFSRQLSRKPVATPAKAASVPALLVDGAKYADAILSSFDGTSVGIAHANGVAKIAANQLTPPQITALNATSTTVLIDSTRIASSPQVVVPTTPPPTANHTPAEVKSKTESLAASGKPSAIPPVADIATLGSSEATFIARYGKAIHRYETLSENNKIRATIDTLMFQKHKDESPIVTVAFVAGRAVDLECSIPFMDLDTANIILEKHSGGSTWKKNKDLHSVRAWDFIRADGKAYAQLHIGGNREFQHNNRSNNYRPNMVRIASSDYVEKMLAFERREREEMQATEDLLQQDQEDILRHRQEAARKAVDGL